MPRLLSPDDACIEVDVPIGRGRRYSGKTIDVADPSHVKALRAAGYSLAGIAGQPVRRGGFECAECGFKSYFRLCSRCGAQCERPDLTA
jgi:hypothetical protein